VPVGGHAATPGRGQAPIASSAAPDPKPQATSITPPAAVAAAPAANSANAGTGGLHMNVQGGARDMADRLLQQARDAQRQGNVDAAEDVYRRAVATHQADAEIYNNYAALLADRGDSARAISMYKLALGLDPTYVDAWSNLGTLFDAMGDHRQATGVFQQVLKLDSTNTAARNGLAEQYQALGDVASARKLFEQVTRAAPEFARAHYELAVLLDGQGDAVGAVREYGLFLQTAKGRYPRMYEDRVRARIAALSGGKT
jgi:Tfp pilus assembly protein PilF